MSHIGCKHLDYDEKSYPQCKLITIEPEGWKYWERPLYDPENYPEQPTKVQFCGQGRGRINGIFDCINPGEMHCHEKQKED